jgi:hypothetical protein
MHGRAWTGVRSDRSENSSDFVTTARGFSSRSEMKLMALGLLSRAIRINHCSGRQP